MSHEAIPADELTSLAAYHPAARSELARLHAMLRYYESALDGLRSANLRLERELRRRRRCPGCRPPPFPAAAPTWEEFGRGESLSLDAPADTDLVVVCLDRCQHEPVRVALPHQVYRPDLARLLTKRPDARGITLIPARSGDKITVPSGFILPPTSDQDQIPLFAQ